MKFFSIYYESENDKLTKKNKEKLKKSIVIH
jgi:hypothetical protein